MIKMRFAGLILLASFAACTSPEPAPPPQAAARFGANDIALYEFADRGMRERIPLFSDSLRHAGQLTETLRILCLELSASPGDSSAIGYVVSALTDSVSEVRTSAAWSIGIIGLESSADTIQSLLKTEKIPGVRAGLWEALGKCLPAGKYPLSMEVPAGSTEIEGWLKGWYAQVQKDRQVPLPESLILLNPTDSSTTFWYWHILGRSTYESRAFNDDMLKRAMESAHGIELRSAVASAAWRCRDPQFCRNLAELTLDPREFPPVRAALIRSLADKQVFTTGYCNTLLNDPVYQVRKSTADNLEKMEGLAHEWLWSADSEIHARTLALNYTENGQRRPLEVMLDSIRTLQNLYTICAYLRELPYYSGWDEQMGAVIDTARNPVVLSSVADAIGKRIDRLHPSMIQALVDPLLLKGDPGAIASISETLRYWKTRFSEEEMNSLISAESWLTFQQHLVLPQETECYNAIAALLREKYGKECADFTPAWNHPIDWPLLNGTKEMKAVICTSEGEISLDLDPYSAPGSVADFIRLSREGYYNGKYIHRVVPNFVAQGGCPRGDGWGSLDYTLRTEISRKSFDTGSIGLASAGMNTESCQWFITHSPPPHLNGRYTVFGEVISGMETVNRLRVGSRILRVEISE